MTMYSSIITRRGVLVGITASGIASPSLKGGTSSKRLAWPDKPTLPISLRYSNFPWTRNRPPELGEGGDCLAFQVSVRGGSRSRSAFNR